MTRMILTMTIESSHDILSCKSRNGTNEGHRVPRLNKTLDAEHINLGALVSYHAKHTSPPKLMAFADGFFSELRKYFLEGGQRVVLDLLAIHVVVLGRDL